MVKSITGNVTLGKIALSKIILDRFRLDTVFLGNVQSKIFSPVLKNFTRPLVAIVVRFSMFELREFGSSGPGVSINLI